MNCPLTLKDGTPCTGSGTATRRDGARPDQTVLVMTCAIHGEVEMNPKYHAATAGVAWTEPVVAEPVVVVEAPSAAAEPVVLTEADQIEAAAQAVIENKAAQDAARTFAAKVAARVKELTT